MISYAHRPSSAAVISAISGAILSASLRTGTTMETATAAWSEEGKSELVGWMVLAWSGLNWGEPACVGRQWNRSREARGVRFYGANAPRATLLRRPEDGPTSG